MNPQIDFVGPDARDETLSQTDAEPEFLPATRLILQALLDEFGRLHLEGEGQPIQI